MLIIFVRHTQTHILEGIPYCWWWWFVPKTRKRNLITCESTTSEHIFERHKNARSSSMYYIRWQTQTQSRISVSRLHTRNSEKAKNMFLADMATLCQYGRAYKEPNNLHKSWPNRVPGIRAAIRFLPLPSDRQQSAHSQICIITFQDIQLDIWYTIQ